MFGLVGLHFLPAPRHLVDDYSARTGSLGHQGDSLRRTHSLRDAPLFGTQASRLARLPVWEGRVGGVGAERRQSQSHLLPLLNRLQRVLVFVALPSERSLLGATNGDAAFDPIRASLSSAICPAPPLRSHHLPFDAQPLGGRLNE